MQKSEERKKQLKRLREIEGKINKHLYTICGIVTVITMFMTLIEFLSRGSFLPAKISFFYLGVLLIYSLHKEIVRWLGRRKVERQGEYFVYGWIGFTALLFVINFATKNYFSYSAGGQPLYILKDVSVLTIQVLAIFIFTRSLKILRILMIRPKS